MFVDHPIEVVVEFSFGVLVSELAAGGIISAGMDRAGGLLAC